MNENEPYPAKPRLSKASRKDENIKAAKRFLHVSVIFTYTLGPLVQPVRNKEINDRLNMQFDVPATRF